MRRWATKKANGFRVHLCKMLGKMLVLCHIHKLGLPQRGQMRKMSDNQGGLPCRRSTSFGSRMRNGASFRRWSEAERARQKVRRAQILLKADADGPNWTDQKIAEAFSCRVQTVEKIRQRLVERGFQETLNGSESRAFDRKACSTETRKRPHCPASGTTPKGYNNWTLRLLARKVVELEIVDAISHETVHRTLKKTV